MIGIEDKHAGPVGFPAQPHLGIKSVIQLVFASRLFEFFLIYTVHPAYALDACSDPSEEVFIHKAV